MPASPITVTIWPSPCRARRQRSSINPISCARPISGRLSAAADRGKAAFDRGFAAHAPDRHRPGKSLQFVFAGALELEQPAEQDSGSSSLTRIASGPASACSRAARLGVSPTMVRSCAVPVPMISPTTTRPVAMPIRVCTRVFVGQLDAADLRHDGDRGANGALRRVLEGAGKPEIGQHAVAHELGDEAAIAPDRAGGGVLIAPDQAAEQFGIDFARQRRRADHVGEQHRHLAPLGVARCSSSPGSHRASRSHLGARDRQSPSAAGGDCPATGRAVRDRARSAPAGYRGRYRSPRRCRHIARVCCRATSREDRSCRQVPNRHSRRLAWHIRQIFAVSRRTDATHPLVRLGSNATGRIRRSCRPCPQSSKSSPDSSVLTGGPISSVSVTEEDDHLVVAVWLTIQGACREGLRHLEEV